MSKYDRQIEAVFILFIIVLGIYYMYLASNTQMLGEDEASYISLAKEFTNLQYNDTIFKPFPLTPLVYSLAFFVFGYSLGVAKAIAALFGVLTIIMLYLFCKKVDKTSFIGVNVFGLTSIAVILTIYYFTHFMMIAYTEIPIAFFSILVVYAILEMKDMKGAIFAGAVMGLAFYTKSTSLLFPATLSLFALILYFWKKDKQFLKLALIACAVSAIIIAPYIVKNVIRFNSPLIEGLNSLPFFDQTVTTPPWLTADIMKSLSISINPIDVFGYIAMFLSLFGIVYVFQEKNKNMAFTLFLFVFFIAFFLMRSAIGSGIGDPRYFSFVFPQVALLGGYFVSKAASAKKYLPLVVMAFFIFSVYTSIGVAASTQQSQRYPADYTDALKWVNQNTPQDAVIFTAYGGSVRYFADRNSKWTVDVKDFPDLMHSTNSTYIYDEMKKYNISYILVWRGVLAQDWIIPQSNIIGVFTYNFVTQVDSDKEHFNMTYSNTNSQGQPDNFIFKVL